MTPFRFVLLKHTLPEAATRESHWDLMLECDRSNTDTLLTFEIGLPFCQWNSPISLKRLANHRDRYLDYEGPISNDRGYVQREATGYLIWLQREDSHFSAVLHGTLLGAEKCDAARFAGKLEITNPRSDGGNNWIANWSRLDRDGTVASVSYSDSHTFSKQVVPQIELQQGLGVRNDAHCGVTVKHRSRVAQNPEQPNLRQVHLLHNELFCDLENKGFSVSSGQLGENILTLGISLLDLPRGTVLEIGETAKLQLTGLRNPCQQLNHFQSGLMEAVLDRGSTGELIRKAGVMAIVLESGPVSIGAGIRTVLPPPPFQRLERV